MGAKAKLNIGIIMAGKFNKVSNPSSGTEMELGRLIGSFIDYRWLISGITALFTVLGLTYVILATPVYRSDALIQVEQNIGTNILSNISSVLPSSQPQSSPEIQLLQSRLVIGKTVEDLKLSYKIKEKYFPLFGEGFSRIFNSDKNLISVSKLEVPEGLMNVPFELKVLSDTTFEITLENGERILGTKGELINKGGIEILISDIASVPGTKFSITRQTELKTINDILDAMSVSDKGKDSGILLVTLDGEDAKLTNKILRNITENYVLQNVERKSEEAEKSLLFINEQLPVVRGNLDSAENKLNLFRQQNDSVDLSLEAKSVLDTMVSIESQLNEITFKEAEISKLYTKEHPAYRALMEKRDTLQKEKSKLDKKVSSMPKTQQEVLRLTRDVEAGQVVYMQLLNKQQELMINKASTVGNVRIVDNAMIEPDPVKPKKALIVVAAFMLGAMFAAGVVALNILLRKGIETAEQLEELGVSVYATIPMSEWQKKQDQNKIKRRKRISNESNIKNSLLAINNPSDLAIEAIRGLRTSLHFAMMGAKNNILMISGASPNIGKSFTSLNLAAVIAQAGKKVLIIDADLRKGYLHDILGYNKKDFGFSAVLAGMAKKEDAIKKNVVENLDVILRGDIPPNPSELLMGSNFSELLEWASENYELVIIDSPPVLAVTDPAIIGRHVGTTLMVVGFEKNTAKEVEISIQRFERAGIEVKGVIINGVVKKASNYYAYGSYAQYGYNYESKE